VLEYLRSRIFYFIIIDYNETSITYVYVDLITLIS